MKSNGAEDNGGNSVEDIQVPTLTVMLDPVTHLVTWRCNDVAISVLQMMLDEVQRQLDIQRRQAAAIEFQKSLADARRTAQLVGGLNLKG